MEIPGIITAIANRYDLMNALSIDVNSAVHFVESFGVVEEDIPLNSMGFYNVAKNVKDGKVKFIQATGDNYITKARPAACAWDPVGGVTYNKSEISLCAHNIQIEHCTEDIPGWEGLFGQGNDVEDLIATEAGQRFFEDMVLNFYRAIGNDLSKIAHLGKHPIIAQAKASYTGDSAKWNRMEKTLNVCGGWLTLVDAIKAQGIPAFNVQINPDHVSGDTYTGDADALFRTMTAAMSPEFKALVAQKRAYGVRPVIMVTGGIFDAYKEWVSDRYVTIPDSYFYKLNDAFCAQIGCDASTKPEDVLGWEGYWVKRMHNWDTTTADLQVYHHRALLTVPKNLGIGIDVQEVSGYNGMGLRLEQSKKLNEVGKIFGSTNYRMGTGIVDDRFIVNANYWAV